METHRVYLVFHERKEAGTVRSGVPMRITVPTGTSKSDVHDIAKIDFLNNLSGDMRGEPWEFVDCYSYLMNEDIVVERK